MRPIAIAMLFLLCSAKGESQQKSAFNQFWEPADSFHNTRFYTALGATAGVSTGFTIGLYKTWYSEFPQSGFHFFDDLGEWNQIDKAGHIYTAYLQSHLFYKASRWTGVSEGKSILIGSLCGTIFQSTVEVLDGFSTQWGFSISDFGANMVGIGSFALQQKAWGEQRFMFKESSTWKSRPDIIINSIDGSATTNLQERGNSLFGSSFTERYLKDYNNQTYWISANLRSLFPDTEYLPPWLNLAVGYGSENLYGGFENRWSTDGVAYELDPDLFPRYRQFYLSLDVDLTQIKTDNYFLKSILSLANIIKIPAPALELTSHGEVVFHFLHF